MPRVGGWTHTPSCVGTGSVGFARIHLT